MADTCALGLTRVLQMSFWGQCGHALELVSLIDR